MQITPWMIYLVTRLDSFKDVFGLISVFAVLGTIGSAFYAAGFPNEGPGWFPCRAKLFYAFVGLIIFLSLLDALIPTTKEAVAMIAAPKIINNSKFQKLPEGLLSLANEWLETRF